MWETIQADRKSRSAIQFLAAVACAVMWSPALAGSLTAAVSQARNDLGEVRCGLFDSADGWRKEERALRAVDAVVKNGAAACDFGVVPPGDYAVAVFHAEQGEPKVDYGFLGKPKQGVGFSNNPPITFGAPDFKTALIQVGTEGLTVPIRLKY